MVGDNHLPPRGLRLNAPYGARCFLTHVSGARPIDREGHVLMHLLALGAF